MKKTKNKAILSCIRLFCCFIATDVYALHSDKNAKVAVFDFGSSAITAKEHLLDQKENIIKESDVIYMPYETKRCVKKSIDGQNYDAANSMPNSQALFHISENCINSILHSVQHDLSMYKINCKTSHKCIAIGTSWLRNASNKENIIRDFDKYKINIKAISEILESNLSYESVMSLNNKVKFQDFSVLNVKSGEFDVIMKNASGYQEIKGGYGIEYVYEILKSHKTSKHLYLSDKELKGAIQDVKNATFDKIKFNKRVDLEHLYAAGKLINGWLSEDMNFGALVTREKISQALRSISQDDNLVTISLKYPKVKKDFIVFIQAALVYIDSIMQNLGIEKIDIVPDLTHQYILVNHKNLE